MNYPCFYCRISTERGALICYADEVVIVPLCPLHMKKTAAFFREDGVPVVNAEGLN